MLLLETKLDLCDVNHDQTIHQNDYDNLYKSDEYSQQPKMIYFRFCSFSLLLNLFVRS